MRPFLPRFPAVRALLLVALLDTAVLAAPTANAAIIIVTSTADSGPGSLRQALTDSQDGDTIQFDPVLNGGTIGLTSAELTVDKSITITGPGSNLLTVSRSSGVFRIFHVMPSRTVTITGLTIQNGSGTGGGVLNDHATLTIDNCVVANNLAPDNRGAGIYSDGSGRGATLTITNSTITGNQAFLAGGGIANDGSNDGRATLIITGSLVTSNVATYQGQTGYPEGDGGGIYNDGANATLEITNSTLSNNLAGTPGTPGLGKGNGGGIWSSGAATIRDSTFINNQGGFGGGITNNGTLTITGGTINNNTATGYHVMFGIYYGDGGGIDSPGTGELTITNTTLSGNRCRIYGGAVHGPATITNCTISNNLAALAGGGVSGGLYLTNCTISGNTASVGGGIYGSPTITNSTISGNSAQPYGGGIYGGGIIRHCTITDNTGNEGGGIRVSGSLAIASTILKTGAFGSNVLNDGGTITSHGYNISSDGAGGFLTGPGDQINTDPLLGPLENNGGATLTQQPLAGSPAINTGDPNFTPPPLTDQRGFLRVYDGRIDIGALEVQPTSTELITISGTTLDCLNSVPGPVPSVSLTLTGTSGGSTLTDSSGIYSFSGLTSGGSYTVTPSKTGLAPGSPDIDSIDTIATQKHFLQIGTPLTGCRLTAANVNGDNSVNTTDVIAIQRFFLQLTAGTANVGKYQFVPENRTYTTIVTNQTGQNYGTIVLGDVAPPFVQ